MTVVIVETNIGRIKDPTPKLLNLGFAVAALMDELELRSLAIRWSPTLLAVSLSIASIASILQVAYANIAA